MRFPITEKLIQRQINHWSRLRELLHDEPVAAEVEQGPIITISRLAGAGGRTLATGLRDRLGLQLQDRSVVDHIARTRHLDPELLAMLDEQDIRQTDLWMRGILENRLFLKEQYRHALTETIDEMAASGGVVFLGRGAGHVLGHRASLRVRLVASRATRQNRLAEKMGLSRAEARALLDETDRRREAYVRKLFSTDPHEPSNYDLVINTDRLSPGDVLELALLGMLGAARRDQKQQVAESK
jgi:cytidylate kinase